MQATVFWTFVLTRALGVLQLGSSWPRDLPATRTATANLGIAIDGSLLAFRRIGFEAALISDSDRLDF
jgi:hypothetical protein